MSALLGGTVSAFFGLTVVFFGFAAFLTGQATAQSWRPAWQIIPAALLLTIADRFLLYAMFDADLASPGGFLVAVAILAAIAGTAYSFTRAAKMVQQYPWLYERRGLFRWRDK